MPRFWNGEGDWRDWLFNVLIISGTEVVCGLIKGVAIDKAGYGDTERPDIAILMLLPALVIK